MKRNSYILILLKLNYSFQEKKLISLSFEKITAHEIMDTIINIPITPCTGRLAFNTKANNDNSVVSILFRVLISIL